jgi:hypothetical protein
MRIEKGTLHKYFERSSRIRKTIMDTINQHRVTKKLVI